LSLEPIYLKLLFLIVVANLAPIIGQRLLSNRFASPLDCGSRFLDGRPLLGSSKTWRGYLFAISITILCAWAEGLDMATGLVFSLAVLVGDSLTSFIKRRLGLVSGGHAPGLDQVLESLLPLLVVQHRFDLALSGILGVVMTFIILDLIFWRHYARPHYS
jgi:CDP-2,3-bis-(O-geranylgeranyl)-sn-glycerol synthase